MTQKSLWENCFPFAYVSRERIHNGVESMAAGSLRNHKHEAESDLEMRQGCNLSKPAPNAGLPPATLYLCIASWNSATNWEPHISDRPLHRVSKTCKQNNNKKVPRRQCGLMLMFMTRFSRDAPQIHTKQKFPVSCVLWFGTRSPCVGQAGHELLLLLQSSGTSLILTTLLWGWGRNPHFQKKKKKELLGWGHSSFVQCVHMAMSSIPSMAKTIKPANKLPRG